MFASDSIFSTTCLNEYCFNYEGVCKRGFDKTVILEKSFFDLKGFPVYKRSNESDLSVVPFSVDILFDWDGHANVE